MWSETIGLTTNPVTKKIGLGLASLMCYVVKHGLVTLVIVIILKDSNFSSTIYSYSDLCLEHHYCRDQ